MEVHDETVIDWFCDLFRAVAEDSDCCYYFKSPEIAETGRTVSIEKREIQAISSLLNAKSERDETFLYDARRCEVLVKDHSRIPSYGPSALFRRQNEIVQEDKVNGISYRLGEPSDAYLVFLLQKVAQIAPLRSAFRYSVSRTMLRRYVEQDVTEEEINPFNLAKMYLPRLITIRIESDRGRAETELDNFVNSFLFQISYNLDIALVQQRFIEEIVRFNRLVRTSRGVVEDIDAPKRRYIPDLIYHYQMGVAADNPSLEFLSFYHVVEHFFESVFEDDLLEKVREAITLPDFSYRRRNDLKKLVNLIAKRKKLQNETVVINEQEALRLTLEKYIDVDETKEKINAYDPNLLAYYRKNDVSFAEGAKVNFDDTENERLISSLASRIYKTRNAIVHSKDSDKGRFIPFHHDKILVKEVPLMRFIAEFVIIKTSQVIGSAS